MLPEPLAILIVGTENLVALPAIRAIGTGIPSASIHTLSVDTDNYQISNYSKYVTRHHRLNATEGEAFTAEVIAKIKETNAQILLPIGEDYNLRIATDRHILAQYVNLPPLPVPELLNQLHHKDELAALLLAKEFPVPITYKLTDKDAEMFPSDLFPCLIKPITGSSGNGIQKIADRNELMEVMPRLSPEEYIVQELIPGEDIDCSFIAVDGKIKAYTIQRGLFNVGYNFSTAIRFDHNELLLEHARRLVAETGFSGLAHLDYRLNKHNGLPYLIDFNARYWFSMEGSKAAGVDFAVLNCYEALRIPYEACDFSHCIFLMGKSNVKRGLKSFFPATNGRLPIFSDLKSRITDPIPELFRYF